jgi:small ligand-binding sensory domain FIST
MPFAAALSTDRSSARALEEACTQALDRFEGSPDLALLFFSSHHCEQADQLAEAAQAKLRPRCLLGCNAEAIIGGNREIEEGPALSLWLGRWRQPVRLTAFGLELEQTPDGYSLMGWPDTVAEGDATGSLMLLLGDPFSFPTDAFLHQLDEDHRGMRVVGGMASGAEGPGESRLILGDDVKRAGAVAVLLQGLPGVRTVVSQGCRPIGRHLVITRAQDNVIVELGGKPPLEHLQNLWKELNPRDQELFQHGLHIGRVINEYQGEFRRGDFLVRNVLGLDRSSGALSITESVRVGQTVQFHVRDAATADEDLHALLQMDMRAHAGKPAAALLFTCNGRGSRLFAEADHDARAVLAETGDVPLAGFFAAGEIGPVGGRNFIHGFTASAVLFEE